MLISIAGIKKGQRLPLPRQVIIQYYLLLLGLLLMGIGSAYHHSNPLKIDVFYDKLPLSLIFLALLISLCWELWRVHWSKPILFLITLSLLGYFLWRFYDRQLYLVSEFYPVLIMIFVASLFHNPANKVELIELVYALLLFVIARICELADYYCYDAFLLSGHTLSHLTLAASFCYVISLYQSRYLTENEDDPAIAEDGLSCNSERSMAV